MAIARAARRIFVQGIDGFGDSLHQRAAIAKLIERGDNVWLTTATPCIYHDLRCDRLHLVDSGSTLRTQARNARREAAAFEVMPTPLRPTAAYRVFYNRDRVEAMGSVLASICAAVGEDPAGADFRLPIPGAWTARTPIPAEPFIVYRPPVERREWAGNATRNPDAAAFNAIFAAVRDGYQVVSVADLEPGEEWIVGAPVAADATYHAGELDFEQLAALTAAAAFVFTTAGMMTVLAQAVSTPCITVFGGYEGAASYSAGAVHSPWLAIEPTNPCRCWALTHDCDKRIDLPRAIARAKLFSSVHGHARHPAAVDLG